MNLLSRAEILRRCGNRPPPHSLRSDDPAEFRERSPQEQAIHEFVTTTILNPYDTKRTFKNRTWQEGQKVEWDELVKAQLPNMWFGQLTGSCVGTNWANVLLCQICVENLIKKTGEEINPRWWWPYTYGWGRHYGGMHSEGEGSYLSVQYRAAKEKGIPYLDDYNFPQFSVQNGARWLTSRLELKWSSKRNIPEELDPIAGRHKVIDGAMIDSMEEIDDAIWEGPLGIASMLGTNRIYKRDGVKMSDWSDRWAHNMGISGAWKHPSLGMLYKILNYSWMPSEYAWFWITRDTLASVLRDRGTEVMVMRDFDGIEQAGMSVEEVIELILSLGGV